jgi:YfiH family protein
MIPTMRNLVNSSDWLLPDWPAPARVRSLVTTRAGGVSVGPYTSLNLGDHVGDDPLAVSKNRQGLDRHLPGPPCWLRQVHGTTVVDAAAACPGESFEADGVFSHSPGVVCAVMTADCLPVLLCDHSASVVAAAHAGWRGLQAGIVEQTVAAIGVPGEQLLAYLGPAIGPEAFEVGDEVRSAFIDAYPEAVAAFVPSSQARNLAQVGAPSALRPAARWLADIYLLARQRLRRSGVNAIYGGAYCTVSEPQRFFSYRRDGVTGRMASLIWLANG